MDGVILKYTSVIVSLCIKHEIETMKNCSFSHFSFIIIHQLPLCAECRQIVGMVLS